MMARSVFLLLWASPRGALRAALPAVLLAAPPLAAQELAQGGATTRDAPTAESLLARWAASRGDRAAWDALVAFEVRGTLGANGRENDVRLLRDRAGRVRYERRYRGMLRVFLDDGERGWLRDWQSESFEPLDAAAREQHLQDVDLLAPLPESLRRYREIEQIGTEQDPSGRGLVVIRLAPPEGLPLDLAIDADTGRAERARYRYVDPEDGGPFEMEVFLLEDLEVEGEGGSIVLSGYQERDQGTSVTVWMPERVELLDRVEPSELRAPP